MHVPGEAGDMAPRHHQQKSRRDIGGRRDDRCVEHENVRVALQMVARHRSLAGPMNFPGCCTKAICL